MPEQVRVIIVDDEPLAQERLRRLIEAESDLAIVGIAGDGASAVQVIEAERPDLAFLDVQMPALDGFAVVEALLERMADEALPLIVFVTAFEEHALRAFEAQALDYLVKPFDDERWSATMDRVRRRIREQRLGAATERLRALLGAAPAHTSGGAVPSASAESPTGRLERIVLRTVDRARLVRAESVDWIEAVGVYARLHIGRDRYLIRIPMHELESRLDPSRFVRIHRSTIVNLDRVRELRAQERGEYTVLLEDGTRLKLSRTRRAHLEGLLGQSL